MAKIITSTGTELDTEGGFSQSATKYAKGKGLSNIICVLSTHPDGIQEYLLLDMSGPMPEPIFSNLIFENIAVRIDIMALDKNLK